MGYNQHHAGLHYISWRRSSFSLFGSDRGYSDDIREALLRKMESEAAKKGVVRRKNINEEVDYSNMPTDGNRGDTTKTWTNDYSAEQTEPQIASAKKGDEKENRYQLIDEDFDWLYKVSKNIYMVAIDHEYDPGIVFRYAEMITYYDDRMNESTHNGQKKDDRDQFTNYEKSILFLALVARRMNVNLGEFFVEKESRDERIISDILDAAEKYLDDIIEENDLDYINYDPESGAISVGITLANYLGIYSNITEEDRAFALDNHDYWVGEARVCAQLNRGKTEEGEFLYSLALSSDRLMGLNSPFFVPNIFLIDWGTDPRLIRILNKYVKAIKTRVNN